MTIKNQLVGRLESKKAVIGILGMGYVGLPLALRYVEAGYKVIGFDIDPEKIRKLEAGETYIEHIAAHRIAEAGGKGLQGTTDFSRAGECDALILCVPTPLTKHREPDLSFVLKTMDGIVPYLRDGQVVSLESTTWPGTTDEELRPRMEKQGFRPGENAFLVFSPEREDPGNPNFSTKAIPKVVGGSTPACLEVGLALYGSVISRLVPVSSTRVAEMTKLLENIHRAVNIGLVNELKIVCHSMRIDIHEVIRAAATKPFGFTPYYPGPGLGGHCIPIDPFYLTWKAREYGLNTRFIELAGEVNTSMPEWVVARISDALNERQKALKNARILVLGIAYKKNVDDMRESPSIEIMELLQEKGVRLEYSDPHVPVMPHMRDHYFDLKSVPLSPATLRAADCVLVATDHSKFDYEMIQRESQLVVDCRGVYKQQFDNLVRA